MRAFLFIPVLAVLALPACVATTSTESEARATPSGDELDLATPDLCGSLAADLAALLAEAQSCNVAAANPTQCANWVPAITGCAAPVASAGSAATVQYLEVYEVYAQSCPLPDRPCVDTTTLSVACTQTADNDSLVGNCTIVDKP